MVIRADDSQPAMPCRFGYFLVVGGYAWAVYLTEDRLHKIALEARGGLRECLKMIELHARDSANAFLNPGIVLTAAATWERFIVDVCLASEDADWRIENTGWKRKYDSTVPWPGSRADRTRKAQSLEHHVDEVLVGNGVLLAPLTASWRLNVSTVYKGADPKDWKWADYSSAPPEDNRDLIREAMLGAKSARDAAAHRLYYKKAREAQGYQNLKMTDDQVDQRDWCYVWQSDNTYKTKTDCKTADNPYPGKPTIQHGYARGVVALFIQLANTTIKIVREHQGWVAADSQLPAAWFHTTMPAGGEPCAGMALWDGQELFC
jgi:hypothetical protein